MSDVVAFVPLRQGERAATASPACRPATPPVFFDRQELSQILAVYSRKVMAGEWRDYAIEPGAEGAVFSVFRRTWDGPAYRVVKLPPAGLEAKTYLVTDRGRVLRRGRALAPLLKVLERTRLHLVARN